MVAISDTNVDELITFLLESPEGREEFQFWDEDGSPDRLAARSFAESMREQLTGHSEISVEQRHHRVMVEVV